MNDLLVRYVEFNNWGNAQIVATAELLTREQLHSGKLSQGNGFETLRHVLDVEWSWRRICQGDDVASIFLWDIEPLEDLASVKVRWHAEGLALLDYVQSLSEADLLNEIRISTWHKPLVIRDILMHLLNHGTNHRSELGWYFTSFGHSPGNLEFLNFVDTLTE